MTLAQLSTLLVQGRISCRRASVLAFNSQLLLRTLPAIEHETYGDDKVQVIIDGVTQPSGGRYAVLAGHGD